MFSLSNNSLSNLPLLISPFLSFFLSSSPCRYLPLPPSLSPSLSLSLSLSPLSLTYTLSLSLLTNTQESVRHLCRGCRGSSQATPPGTRCLNASDVCNSGWRQRGGRHLDSSSLPSHRCTFRDDKIEDDSITVYTASYMYGVLLLLLLYIGNYNSYVSWLREMFLFNITVSLRFLFCKSNM